MPSLNTDNSQLLDPDKLLREYLEVAYKDRVADLGCGAMGHFALAASRLVGQDGMVYAVDVLRDVLSAINARARTENINNIATIWSDLEVYGAAKVPEDVDSATLVTCLFQNKEPLKIIKEAVRLLKPNGKLMIIEWLPNNTPLGPAVDKRLSPQKIKDMASSVGLHLLQEFSAGLYHYGLIFKK